MKSWLRFAWIPVGFMLSQGLCVWIFVDGLLHFYDHQVWVNVLNSLGIPLCCYNIYKMGRTTGEIYRDHKLNQATLAAWRRLRDRGRYIKGPEELEAYIRELEELDPAFAADVRKNLQEFLPNEHDIR
jgi:hypothetical protein